MKYLEMKLSKDIIITEEADQYCCRKGYTVEDLAGMAGKTPATIKKWFKRLGDNELKDYLWKYEGKIYLPDLEGVPALFKHLR